MDEGIKKSAVCIPFIPNGNSYDVLFEVRSSQIKAQPGDICFPGGMIEKGESPEQAAVREVCEELLIKPEQMEVLGQADLFFNPSGLIIYPFPALLKDYEDTFSRDEVEEVFRVPLEFFLNTEPDIYYVEAKIQKSENFPYEYINGGENYRWRKQLTSMIFYHWEDKHIWGITAKMMMHFVNFLKKEKTEE